MMKATKVIPISPRTEGMVDASAEYYQESRIFHGLQNTQALEYDRIDTDNIDLALQLSPLTATWGLVYWEIAVGLIPRPLDEYERRRPPILARLINEENFSADMIYKIAEGFGANIRVYIDSAACLVDVTFLQSIPSYLDEFNDALQNIIHAHLGVEYFFEYHMNGEIQVETSYRRYVYRLPVACLTLLCGTLPTVATLGRLYPATISMETDNHARLNDYKNTGLYASGPYPYVATAGRIYPEDVGVEIGIRNREQLYTVSGTAESGTRPDKTTDGRLYTSEINAEADYHTAYNEYKKTGLYASGPRPFVAVDGRVYPATVGGEIGVRHRDQPYTVSGTAESGTRPEKAADGRLYSTDVTAQAEASETQQTYPVSGVAESGTLPSKAVDGRLYSADVSADADSHSATETYKLCNQFYSGGEPKHDNDERT